jgi:hypothetical protein
MNDPLFDRIRSLPRATVDPPLADRVRRQALAALEVRRPVGARQVIAAAVVAASMLIYFGWAVAFVLAPHL